MEVGLRLRVLLVYRGEEFDDVLRRHREDHDVVRRRSPVGRRRAAAVEERDERALWRRVDRHPLQPRFEDDEVGLAAVQKPLHRRVRAVLGQPVRVGVVRAEREVRTPLQRRGDAIRGARGRGRARRFEQRGRLGREGAQALCARVGPDAVGPEARRRHPATGSARHVRDVDPQRQRLLSGERAKVVAREAAGEARPDDKHARLLGGLGERAHRHLAAAISATTREAARAEFPGNPVFYTFLAAIGSGEPPLDGFTAILRPGGWPGGHSHRSHRPGVAPTAMAAVPTSAGRARSRARVEGELEAEGGGRV